MDGLEADALELLFKVGDLFFVLLGLLLVGGDLESVLSYEGLSVH